MNISSSCYLLTTIFFVDTWTFYEVLEAFTLILEVEQHTRFHVLPPNHRQHIAIPQLQFAYDLLQKITKMKLWSKQGKYLFFY